MMNAGLRPVALALVPWVAPFAPLAAAPGGDRSEAAVQNAGRAPGAAAFGILMAITAAWLASTPQDPDPAWPLSGGCASPVPEPRLEPSGFLGAHLEYGRQREVLWGRLNGAGPPRLAPAFAAALSEVPADALGRACPGIPLSALGLPERPSGPLDYPRANQVLREHLEILRTKRDSARVRLDSDPRMAAEGSLAGDRTLAPAAGDLDRAASRTVAGMYEAAFEALDGWEPLGTWEQVADLDRALRPVLDQIQAVSHEEYVNRIGLRVSELERDVVRNRLAGLARKALCMSGEDARRKADLETAVKVHEADITAALARQDRMVQAMSDVRAALDALHGALAGEDLRAPGGAPPLETATVARMPDEETRDL